jgi:outer membrane protein OmpA-like peptidoglycan-associated protein
MKKKLLDQKHQILPFLLLIMLSSCYRHGPLHEPYGADKITPPPPVAKKLAAPFTKGEYMKKTFEEMQQALPEADVKMVEDSIKVLFPNNIVYEKSSLIPSSDYQQPLISFSGLLKKYNKTNILVTGHTDNRGVPEKNKEISRERALNIVNFIIEQGIQKTRLETFGLGDLSPIADNSTDEGRSRNRRVEFVVLYKD